MEARAGEKQYGQALGQGEILPQHWRARTIGNFHKPNLTTSPLWPYIHLLNYLCSLHIFLRSQFVLLIFVYLLVAGTKLFTYHVLNKCYITKYKDYCNLRYLQPDSSEQDPVYIGCSRPLLFMIESQCDFNVSYVSQTSHPHPNQIRPYRQGCDLKLDPAPQTFDKEFALPHPLSQGDCSFCPCKFSYRIVFSSFLLVLYHRTYYL